jgi:hypothetical protein
MFHIRLKHATNVYLGANEVIGANYGVTTTFLKPLLIV